MSHVRNQSVDGTAFGIGAKEGDKDWAHFW